VCVCVCVCVCVYGFDMGVTSTDVSRCAWGGRAGVRRVRVCVYGFDMGGTSTDVSQYVCGCVCWCVDVQILYGWRFHRCVKVCGCVDM